MITAPQKNMFLINCAWTAFTVSLLHAYMTTPQKIALIMFLLSTTWTAFIVVMNWQAQRRELAAQLAAWRTTEAILSRDREFIDPSNAQ